MCDTFMSFTMAWNNPPSAPHSFSTDSMVSKTNKKSSRKDKYQTKYSTVAASNVGRVDLCFLHPSFEVLPYNNVACSEEDARTHSPQPAAERTDKKKCAARCHRVLLLALPPVLAFRWHRRDGAGALSSARLDYSYATWRAHARWLLMITV